MPTIKLCFESPAAAAVDGQVTLGASVVSPDDSDSELDCNSALDSTPDKEVVSADVALLELFELEEFGSVLDVAWLLDVAVEVDVATELDVAVDVELDVCDVEVTPEPVFIDELVTFALDVPVPVVVSVVDDVRGGVVLLPPPEQEARRKNEATPRLRVRLQPDGPRDVNEVCIFMPSMLPGSKRAVMRAKVSPPRARNIRAKATRGAKVSPPLAKNFRTDPQIESRGGLLPTAR